MNKKNEYTRRTFLGISAALGAGILAGAEPTTVHAMENEAGSEDIKPVEDLMREHGVLRRVLLIYEEAARGLRNSRAVTPELVSESAAIIKTFIEDYHEKSEEEYIFPRFEKKGLQLALVNVLFQQHDAGRGLTTRIRQLATAAAFDDPAARQVLSDSLRWFVRMYRPHAAREDTILFPAFRDIVQPGEYAELGKIFEEREHRMFGENGFDNMVVRVADIEKQLGIYEIAQFMPRESEPNVNLE